MESVLEFLQIQWGFVEVCWMPRFLHLVDGKNINTYKTCDGFYIEHPCWFQLVFTMNVFSPLFNHIPIHPPTCYPSTYASTFWMQFRESYMHRDPVWACMSEVEFTICLQVVMFLIEPISRGLAWRSTRGRKSCWKQQRLKTGCEDMTFILN